MLEPIIVFTIVIEVSMKSRWVNSYLPCLSLLSLRICSALHFHPRLVTRALGHRPRFSSRADMQSCHFDTNSFIIIIKIFAMGKTQFLFYLLQNIVKNDDERGSGQDLFLNRIILNFLGIKK